MTQSAVPLLLCLLVCLPWQAHADEAAATSPSGTLYWSSGEALPGRLLEADGESFRWSCPLFVSPLSLNPRYLKSVEFPATADTADPGDPFRVVLRNGDTVYADLAALNESRVSLTSQRHGSISLDRSAVRMLRRMNNPATLFSGPSSLSGWVTLTQGAALERWQISTEGHLSTSGWQAELFRSLPLTPQSEIELSLASTDKLRFLIALSDSPDDSVRLETWDDELVALVGDDFEPIMNLSKRPNQLDLRLHWNRDTGSLSIYSRTGSRLATVTGATQSGQPGIYIRNKGSQLTVSSLRVNRWNGTAPREVREGSSRIHLIDGTVRYGVLTGFQPADGTVRLRTDDGEVTAKLSDVDRIYLADDASDQPTDGLVQAWYHDGTRLTGTLKAVGENSITLVPPGSEDPVVSTLAGARRLTFQPSGQVPADGPDTLFCEGGTLHGTLTGGNSPDSAVLWRPVGGLSASALAPGAQARFVRGQSVKAFDFDQTRFADRLFLTTHDVVPCRIRTIDDQVIELQTAFSERTRIPVEFVKAIELSSDGSGAGFTASGWEQVSGEAESVIVEPESLTVRRKVSFGHPDVLRGGDDIRFTLRWKGRSQTLVDVSLFVSDLDDPERAADMQFSCQMDRVVVFSGGRPVYLARNTVTSPDTSEARVRIRHVQGTRQIYINEQPILQTGGLGGGGFPAPAAVGRGLLFSIEPGQASRLQFAEVTLTDLEITATESEARQTVADLMLRQMLTIPRFRRDNPATHVLVSPAGDLLRGRLTSLDDQSVRFVSRLSEFNFERRRAAAVVWLHPLQETPAPAWDPELPVIRVLLGNGDLIVVMNPERMADGRLVGHSPILGRCEVPIETIRELHAGGFGPLNDAKMYAHWIPELAPEPDITDATGGSSGFKSPLMGLPAPDFITTLLDGTRIRLSSLRGRVVVLDFWATWCGPCVRAMPELEKCVSGFDSDQVVLLAVNQEEPAAQIREFLELRNLDITVALDPQGRIGGQYGVDDIPQTIVVGPDGNVVWHSLGFSSDGIEQLRIAIRKLLDGEPLPGDAPVRKPSGPASSE